MKERVLIASLVITTMMLSVSQAQVAQLGSLPTKGRVKPAGMLAGLFHRGGGCDATCTGCASPSCGAASPDCGCAIAEPGCGIGPTCGVPGTPSCGMAGRLLGGLKGMLHIEPACGMPEPGCGAQGLGYSGGFGLCGGCDGGGCNSCGVGGYFGRNLHQVNPCACGGSIFGDVARGFLTFIDQAVGTLVGSFFGGLQAATCHASGTFAALQSAAMCGLCGDSSCDGGCAMAAGGCALGNCSDPLGCTTCGVDPSCGIADGIVSHEYTNDYSGQHDYSHSSSDVYMPAPAPPVASPQAYPADTPAPTPATPLEAAPTSTSPQNVDPFMDDPSPLSRNTRRTGSAVAGGYRVYRGGNPRLQRSVPQQRSFAAGYRPQQHHNANLIGSAVQRATGKVKSATATAATPLMHRYLQSQKRAPVLRR